MANVLNRTTMRYISSVNTPDYPENFWVVNPDLSGVKAVPQKYWKLTGDIVSEMNETEKKVVDEAASTKPPTFHASSSVVGTSVQVTEPGPSWQELGGVVTTPSFFTPNLTACKGRVVGEYMTSGGELFLRVCEDGREVGQVTLADSTAQWKKMKWHMTESPTEGSHTYTLETRTSAKSAQLRFCSISLLEFH